MLIKIRGRGLRVSLNPTSTKPKESHPAHQANTFSIIKFFVLLFTLALFPPHKKLSNSTRNIRFDFQCFPPSVMYQ
jgi:hypothetical protein